MESFLFNTTPSPLQSLEHHPICQKYGVRLMLKRDDLLHPTVSGNKWRKLKYNLQAAQLKGLNTLLTFGGAYSNHIYATAAAGKLMGFRTIGIIRGEEHLPLNATLQFARSQGMELHYMDRATYRHKSTTPIVEQLKATFGKLYIIPEGGSNIHALPGCAELVEEIHQPFDVFCCACGTGGTLAGVLTALPENVSAYGFSALKGGAFLADEIRSLLQDAHARARVAFQIVTDYHFGGYAKMQPSLLSFIENFSAEYHVPLEPVYTGKMLYGIFDMIQKGTFPRGTSIVALHSGGLQVNQSGTYRR